MTEQRLKLRGDGRSRGTVEPIARNIVIRVPKSILLQCNKSNCGLIFFGSEGAYGQAVARPAHPRPQLLCAALCRADPGTVAIRTGAGRRPYALAEGGRFAEVPALQFPWFVHRSRQADEALRARVRRMSEETGAEVFLRQQQAIMTRPDARPLLPSIKCPTLVLVGDGDELTPPALSQEIAAGVTGSRLVVIADCGHLSTMERPDAVNRALIEWMTG